MAARDRRMGVLNELIGAVSGAFLRAVVKRGDYLLCCDGVRLVERRMTWTWLIHMLIFRM